MEFDPNSNPPCYKTKDEVSATCFVFALFYLWFVVVVFSIELIVIEKNRLLDLMFISFMSYFYKPNESIRIHLVSI